LAVEAIDSPTLADWSGLVGARISVPERVAPESDDIGNDIGGGTLRVSVSARTERRALANAQRHLLTSGAIALALAFAASLVLSRALAGQIRRMGEAGRSITSETLPVRLRSNRRDELGDVAHAFDAMLDRIQASLEMLARAQQLAELGSWTLDLSSGTIEC